MTAQQIKWAAEHDWFDGWTFFNDFSCDKVVWTKSGESFTDFWKLRAWAGY
jgi:hypothetical protein